MKSYEDTHRLCACCGEVFSIDGLSKNAEGYYTCPQPRCGEREDIFPAWMARCHCCSCSEDQTYECAHCGRKTPWCFGAVDGHPDCCDDCWEIKEMPYEVQSILNETAKTRESFDYLDLMKIEFEGPEDIYDIGLGRTSTGNADLRLVVRRGGITRIVAECSERDNPYGVIEAEAYELKPGDHVVLQYRADGTGFEADVSEATLVVEATPDV